MTTESNINLTLFVPKYRQALLYAMIEGLIDGAAFTFIDNRGHKAIETELKGADLMGCRWTRKSGEGGEESVYLVEKTAVKTSPDLGCCGGCGGHTKG